MSRDKLFDGVLIVGLKTQVFDGEDDEDGGISMVPEIVYTFPPIKADGHGGVRRGKDQDAGEEESKDTEDEGDEEEERAIKGTQKADNDKGDDRSGEEKGQQRDRLEPSTDNNGDTAEGGGRKRRRSVMLMDVDGSLAKDTTLLDQIREFCFPDVSSIITISQKRGNPLLVGGKKSSSPWKWKIKKKKLIEERFSFVLTASSGERRWGYCARMIPTPRSGAPMLPWCFCILSFNPCFRIYSKILDTLIEFQQYRPRNYCSCDIFLKTIYKHPLPPPGGTLDVRMTGLDTSYTFSRPDDMESLLDHVTFDQLLTKLDGYSILAIFASLLVERRFIFIADNLGTLSSCTQAVIALLYPFTWQHIFIPVLPPSLLHFCSAPMPFVCGVLRSCVPVLKKYSNSMEAVILVDIDNNEVIFPDCFQVQGEGGKSHDFERIPADIANELIEAIDAATKTVKTNRKKKKKMKMSIKRPSLGVSSGQKVAKEAAAVASASASPGPSKDGAAASAAATAGAGSSSSADTQEKNRTSNAVKKDLSNAFIGFMVDLLATYRSFLIPKGRTKNGMVDVGENWCFDKTGFIEKQPLQLQPLLDLVVQSQMFVVFLNERSKSMGPPNRRSVNALRGAGIKFSGKFEKRLTTHLKKGLVRESSRNSLSPAWFNARSRFTMYENGQITRNEITKSFKQMREEENNSKVPVPAFKKAASSPGKLTQSAGGSWIKRAGLGTLKRPKSANDGWDIELGKPENFRHVSHLGDEVVNNSIFDVLELLCNPKQMVRATLGAGSSARNASPPLATQSAQLPRAMTSPPDDQRKRSRSDDLSAGAKKKVGKSKLIKGLPSGRNGKASDSGSEEGGGKGRKSRRSGQKGRKRGVGTFRRTKHQSPGVETAGKDERSEESNNEGKKEDQEDGKQEQTQGGNNGGPRTTAEEKEGDASTPGESADTTTIIITPAHEPEYREKEIEGSSSPPPAIRVDPRMEALCMKLGLPDLAALFMEEDVAYDDMFLLSEEDLISIGVKMGPRKRFLNALKEMQQGAQDN